MLQTLLQTALQNPKYVCFLCLLQMLLLLHVTNNPHNATPMKYPVYYRKAGRCIKRESDTCGILVEVPAPSQTLPLIQRPLSANDKEQFDKVVKDMALCPEADFDSYLASFYHACDANRIEFGLYRERKFESAKSTPNNRSL